MKRNQAILASCCSMLAAAALTTVSNEARAQTCNPTVAERHWEGGTPGGSFNDPSTGNYPTFTPTCCGPSDGYCSSADNYVTYALVGDWGDGDAELIPVNPWHPGSDIGWCALQLLCSDGFASESERQGPNGRCWADCFGHGAIASVNFTLGISYPMSVCDEDCF
jgi:hypothetical protein